MKRFLTTLIGAIMLLMVLTVTVSAAELNGFYFTPNGEITEVEATANINIRDKNYDNPVEIKKGQTMWFLGDSTTWEDRAMVIGLDSSGNSRLGTVLEDYIKPTGRKGFSYQEECFYAKTTSSLRQRGPNYEALSLLNRNSNVYVFGRDEERSERAVIFEDNSVSTVLKNYLKKTATGTGSENSAGSGIQTKPENIQTECFIVSTAEFNLRAESETPGELGELLHPEALPEGEVFLVYGECPTDSSRWSVSWGNVEGTIMKSKHQKVLDYIPYNKVATPYAAITYEDKVLLAGDGKTVLDKIPANSIFMIYGVSKEHSGYWLISWQGNVALVSMEKTYRVGDAIFVDEEVQKASLYKKSKIMVLAQCVTGTEDVSESPTGRYWVTMMESPKTLRGVNLQGEPYAQPVDYFIAYCGDAGLHDASWRDDFGKDASGRYIYEYSGSLMCINTPNWFAQIVYKNTYDGMMFCVTEELEE